MRQLGTTLRGCETAPGQRRTPDRGLLWVSQLTSREAYSQQPPSQHWPESQQQGPSSGQGQPSVVQSQAEQLHVAALVQQSVHSLSAHATPLPMPLAQHAETSKSSLQQPSGQQPLVSQQPAVSHLQSPFSQPQSTHLQFSPHLQAAETSADVSND